MVAAVMGDFDILKQLYDAKNKTVFRKGDRFCDQRRQRVKFMRAWRAATCKPLHTIANARERRNEAAVLIQDMVRTAMEHRGIWKLPTPFGHVVEVESTKFGDKMTIEYHDEQKTRETNFLLEFQHLELLVSLLYGFEVPASPIQFVTNRVFLCGFFCRRNDVSPLVWT